MNAPSCLPLYGLVLSIEASGFLWSCSARASRAEHRIQTARNRKSENNPLPERQRRLGMHLLPVPERGGCQGLHDHPATESNHGIDNFGVSDRLAGLNTWYSDWLEKE